jgi:uncharacterized protein involved in exopolysaccharide biosynthesis
MVSVSAPVGEANWVDDRDSAGLRRAVLRLWQRRWWIVLAIVACTAVAAVAAFLTTPVYRATTVMVPAGSERSNMGAGLNAMLGQLGGLAAMAGVNVSATDIETEEALAVLKSRQFTESFIQDKQLMPTLFAHKWDAQRRTWKAGKQPTAAQAYKYFSKKVRTVTQDKKTGLVTLDIDWRDRELAAQWANELVQRLNTEMRARAIDKANASVGYLESELERTTVVATREAINRLIEAQIQRRMLANVTQEFAFRIVDRALPPDRDDPIRPKKLLLIAVGFVLGIALGVIAVLFAAWLSAEISSGKAELRQ